MTTNDCSKKLCPMQVGTVDNCTLTKEQCPYFTQAIDYQNVLNQIKAAVAREIFAEIDEICRKYFNQCSKEPDSELMKMLQQGERFVINEMWHEFAELKKKYERKDNK